MPCPPPGDLSDPGIKPESLTSPAQAGGLFTRGSAHHCWSISIFITLDKDLPPAGRELSNVGTGGEKKVLSQAFTKAEARVCVCVLWSRCHMERRLAEVHGGPEATGDGLHPLVSVVMRVQLKKCSEHAPCTQHHQRGGQTT